MCGIIGVVTSASNGFSSSEATIFEQMLYMDALRGDDSTGVAAFHNDGEGIVLKDASPAAWYLYSKEWGELRLDAIKNGKALIGHNRKSTVGKTSDETAHPFVIDDRYMFVHNGTLQNHKQIHDTEVDSEALGMLLTRCEGDPLAIEKALADVQGAYACVWIDKVKEKLYMLRNKERPLVYCKVYGSVFFSSELGFLATACARNNHKLEKAEEVKPSTLYTVDLAKHGVDITETELTIPKKATPTFPMLVRNGGQDTTPATEKNKGGASKNAAKRFQKKSIGETIEFWCDDYVEATVDSVDEPLTNSIFKWMVLGENLQMNAKHVIKGFLSCSYTDIKRIEGSLCTGVVTSVEFNKKQRVLEIYVSNVKMKPYNAGWLKNKEDAVH